MLNFIKVKTRLRRPIPQLLCLKESFAPGIMMTETSAVVIQAAPYFLTKPEYFLLLALFRSSLIHVEGLDAKMDTTPS